MIKAYNTLTGPVAEIHKEDGTIVQFVSLTPGGIIMSHKSPATGSQWSPVINVVDPERFGQWQTVKQMKQWAENFAEALVEL
jgi:hypothetical protein